MERDSALDDRRRLGVEIRALRANHRSAHMSLNLKMFIHRNVEKSVVSVQTRTQISETKADLRCQLKYVRALNLWFYCESPLSLPAMDLSVSNVRSS